MPQKNNVMILEKQRVVTVKTTCCVSRYDTLIFFSDTLCLQKRHVEWCFWGESGVKTALCVNIVYLLCERCECMVHYI